MKGVVLAGGLGSRLFPLTRVTNKHLLPVYKKPMIFYPIQALVNAGINEIMVVTGGNNAGDFLKLLGNGHHFGLQHLNYAYQEGEGGIAAALALTEHFVGDDKVVVFLGDNVIEGNINKAVADFERQPSGGKIMLKKVHDPQRFGVPAFDEQSKITEIVEKPEHPASEYAVIGVYMYDSDVFKFIHTLEPSDRGELEITDVNNYYLRRGDLTYEPLDGWWTDAGTFDSLLLANNLVAESGANKTDI